MINEAKQHVEAQLQITKYWKQPRVAQAYREGAEMMYHFIEANPHIINPKLGLLLRGYIYPSKQNYIDYGNRDDITEATQNDRT